ncbi:MAG TPA: SIMPL domain-containing protein [Pyrinomonadaceae bacterium]|nr:SIMPL domain-containing protein [Pyrinomonadaceae bacterium]
MKRLLIGFAAIMMLVSVASQVFAAEVSVTGRLQRTVEPGGWVIVSPSQKYFILNWQRFQNESWFSEATEVEAVGELKPDVVTTHMEGSPFEVRTIRPLTQQSTGATQPASGNTRVIVSGDSIVQAKPDTAIVTITVVSQAKRAIDAQQDNAVKSDAVAKALKSAAGPGAEVKTSGYSLQPMRVYKEGQPPAITGYEARNSVTVTMSDLTKVGNIIDASSQAGANDVTGLSFTLRQDQAARDQAIAEATREAVNKARVIATALGGRVVRIVEVQEEGTNRPKPTYEMDQVQTMRGASAPSTPIEAGTLDITSRVQLIAEIAGFAR